MELNNVQAEGHHWEIEQSADRGAPVGNITRCGQRGTSGEYNKVQAEGHQWGIDQGADRGGPVWNRTVCRRRGTGGE